jgi:Tol biopolymer transport system component
MPITQTTFSEGSGQFSPDGHWVAYQSTESSDVEIHIQSLRGQRKVQVSRGGGSQARWRQDGKELYYLTPDHRLMAVPVQLGPGSDDVDLGAAAALFQTHLTGNTTNGRHFHVSADGQRFLIDTVKEITSPITVLLNWKPGP